MDGISISPEATVEVSPVVLDVGDIGVTAETCSLIWPRFFAFPGPPDPVLMLWWDPSGLVCM